MCCDYVHSRTIFPNLCLVCDTLPFWAVLKSSNTVASSVIIISLSIRSLVGPLKKINIRRINRPKSIKMDVTIRQIAPFCSFLVLVIFIEALEQKSNNVILGSIKFCDEFLFKKAFDHKILLGVIIKLRRLAWGRGVSRKRLFCKKLVNETKGEGMSKSVKQCQRSL